MNRAILSIAILAAAVGVLLIHSPSLSGGTYQDAGGTVSEPETPTDVVVPALTGTAWRLVVYSVRFTLP
jgi:hypothetical protein